MIVRDCLFVKACCLLPTFDDSTNTNRRLEVAAVLGAVESVQARQRGPRAGGRPLELRTPRLDTDLQLEKHRRASLCIQ